MSKPTAGRVGRRNFLRHTGAAFGAAAFTPLLGTGLGGQAAALTPGVADPSADPDALFRIGRFVEADAGYECALDERPDDAHALAQRGYIALLANRFADAEEFLTRAIDLYPNDPSLKAKLGECFVRQDDFERAVPLLRAGGETARATQCAAVSGQPYEVHGADTARLPFLVMDPLPVLEASVNGMPPQQFMFDTGATLSISAEMAEQAGIRTVATREGIGAGRPVTLNLGVADSLQLGGIELRNVPLYIGGRNSGESHKPRLADGSQPPGTFGTTILYHFLSTLDYANKALVLRRRTDEQLEAFKREAEAAGAATAPLWMAGDHFLHSEASLNGHGPMLVFVDTGGPGFGVGTSEEIAGQVGFELDRTRPRSFLGGKRFPFTAEEVSLGSAVRRDVPGLARPGTRDEGGHLDVGFHSSATLTHEFFRPLSATFDFVNTQIHVTGGA